MSTFKSLIAVWVIANQYKSIVAAINVMFSRPLFWGQEHKQMDENQKETNVEASKNRGTLKGVRARDVEYYNQLYHIRTTTFLSQLVYMGNAIEPKEIILGGTRNN